MCEGVFNSSSNPQGSLFDPTYQEEVRRLVGGGSPAAAAATPSIARLFNELLGVNLNQRAERTYLWARGTGVAVRLVHALDVAIVGGPARLRLPPDTPGFAPNTVIVCFVPPEADPPLEMGQPLSELQRNPTPWLRVVAPSRLELTSGAAWIAIIRFAGSAAVEIELRDTTSCLLTRLGTTSPPEAITLPLQVWTVLPFHLRLP
jgi:hypothetical protein